MTNRVLSDPGQARKTHLSAGIDAGSSAIKVAIMRSNAGSDGEIVVTTSQRIRRRRVHDVVRATFDQACAEAKVKAGDFCYVASTGDGDAVPFATGHFYGMTTHARGALYVEPGARAVLDMGALHARAIKMDERGRVLGHRMTSQCASGSGSFLENIARYLGVPLEDVGELSNQSKYDEEVSSVCAVLAETDVINMVSRGLTTSDILRAIHLSIGGRLMRLLHSAGAEGLVALSGGLAQDAGLVTVLRELVGKEQIRGKKRLLPSVTLEAHELAPYNGALGAALLGAYRFEQLRKLGRAELVAVA